MYLENYNNAIENVFNILSNDFYFKVFRSEHKLSVYPSKNLNLGTSESFIYGLFLGAFIKPIIYQYRSSTSSDKNILDLEFNLNQQLGCLIQQELKDYLYSLYFQGMSNGA